MRKVSIGDWVAGFWSSSWKTEPGRVCLGRVTLIEPHHRPIEVQELIGRVTNHRLGFVGVYRDMEGNLSVEPTNDPCLVRIEGCRLVGLVPHDEEGYIPDEGLRMLSQRHLQVAVLPRGGFSKKGEAQCAVLEGPEGPSLVDKIVWPDRNSEAYGQRLMELLDRDRSQYYGHLSDVEFSALREYVFEFRSCYWIEGSPMSTIFGVRYDVVLDDPTPLEQHAFKAPPFKQAMIDRHIKKEIDLGTLKQVPGGRYLSPCFVVGVGQLDKPDGRLVCDYRKINNRTRKALFPMPDLWGTLRRVSHAPFKTVQDAVSGFNQVKLTDRAKESLMIVTANGTFAWQVLPFGPTNGPQNFQQIMRRKFQPCEEEVAIFIDDMLLYA